MNTTLNNSSKCFGIYDENIIIGFIGIIHQPCKNLRLKRVTRLVILPDYQGIGLGVKLLNIVAEYYNKLNFDLSIKTSAKNLIFALKKNEKWLLSSYGYSIKNNKQNTYNNINKEARNKNKTASFFYKRK